MAPEVGQHTIEVLTSLGYSQDAIGDLLRRGVAMDPSEQKQERQAR
jgi:crotonobetainyl-CoA:carnitine CoA-transferase CaiB-like acyl-CoA transferase